MCFSRRSPAHTHHSYNTHRDTALAHSAGYSVSLTGMDSLLPQPSVALSLQSSGSTFVDFAEDIGLDRRLVKALSRAGFQYPTAVQAAALPLGLAGKDLLVRSKTGSGKTAAYGLCVLQKLLTKKTAPRAAAASSPSGPSALILVPSRELVDQTGAALSALALYCNDLMRIVTLGGGSTAEQAARLSESPDIIVTTPGRLVAHLSSGALSAAAVHASCDSLVVDEADLLLAYGGGSDIRTIVAALSRTVQAWLLSATLSPELEELQRVTLHSPAVVQFDAAAGGGSGGGAPGRSSGAPNGTDGVLTQFYLRVGSMDRYLLLFALIKLRLLATRAIVFVNSTETAYRIKLFLDRFSIGAGVLNGELPANSRAHIIQSFNRGAFDFLVATDGSEGGAGDNTATASAATPADDEFAAAVTAEGGTETVAAASSSSVVKQKEGKGKKRRRADAAAAAAGGSGGAASSTAGAAAVASDVFGVSRGLDFRGVATVLNFDAPTSATSYIHRIGRTARGGASGVSLTLLPPLGVDAIADGVLNALHSRSGGGGPAAASATSSGSEAAVAPLVPAPLPFDVKEVEGFRYRVEDVLRGITASVVATARAAELRRELLASVALKAHFEDNPRDIELLKHDKLASRGASSMLHRAEAVHLRDVPSYLLPPALRAAVEAAGGGVDRGTSRKAKKTARKAEKGKTKTGPAVGGGKAADARAGVAANAAGVDGNEGGASAAASQATDAAAAPIGAGHEDGEGGGGDGSLAEAAASGKRVSARAVVAMASSDVYRPSRNRKDPLRTFTANAASLTRALGGRR